MIKLLIETTTTKLDWRKSLQNNESASPFIAVIDLGSNSVQLLLARFEKGHFHVAEQYKHSLKLGAHLDEHSYLSEKAIEKTVHAFREIKSIADNYRPIFRATATYACRIAKNRNHLFKEIYNATGIEVELIDGIEEARLISLGVRFGLSIEDESYFIVDCGGGSTEIISGQKNKIDFVTSLPLGSVVATKKILGHNPDDLSVLTLQKKVRFELGPFLSAFKGMKPESSILSSSIAKALAYIHHQLFSKNSRYHGAHGYLISAKELNAVTKQLKKRRSSEDISAQFDLEAHKAEIIIAGASILNEVSKIAGVKNWLISTSAIREGVFLDTLSRLKGAHDFYVEDGNVRKTSVSRLGERFKIDKLHAKKVANFAASIYAAVNAFDPLEEHLSQISNKEILESAAWLFQCGKYLSYQGYHKHSYYLIRNSRMFGYSELEKQLIGLVSRFQRKGRASYKHEICEGLEAHELNRINKLASILRLAASLNRSRQNTFEKLECKIEGGSIIIYAHTQLDFEQADLDLSHAKRACGFLAEIYDMPVTIECYP